MNSEDAFYAVPLHTQTTGPTGEPLHTYRWLNKAGQHRNAFDPNPLTIADLQAKYPDEEIAPRSIEKLSDAGVQP